MKNKTFTMQLRSVVITIVGTGIMLMSHLAFAKHQRPSCLTCSRTKAAQTQTIKPEHKTTKKCALR